MIRWSQTLPAVARRIRRCSSVARVVGERFARRSPDRTGSLGGGGSQADWVRFPPRPPRGDAPQFSPGSPDTGVKRRRGGSPRGCGRLPCRSARAADPVEVTGRSVRARLGPPRPRGPREGRIVMPRLTRGIVIVLCLAAVLL